jgi:hypothetical protein
MNKENDEIIYTSQSLYTTFESTGITVPVGGLPISVQDLASKGWTCRIRYNRYGGRTYIALRSADERSIITFKVSDRYRRYNLTEHFQLISGAGILTSASNPFFSTLPTDEVLLDIVSKRIKARLKSKKRVKRSNIEKAMAFAATA